MKTAQMQSGSTTTDGATHIRAMSADIPATSTTLSYAVATGSAEHVLGTLSELTFGRNAIMPDTDALLAAIGAAWALDIAPDLIGAGIKTFEPELPSVSTLPT